jgi:hypothetical protein
MVKTKPLRKRKISLRKRSNDAFNITLRDDIGITFYSPTEKLKDIKLIGAAIIECLVENNPDGAMDAIETHLECYE